ncbi:MAG: Gmad2 immunoglobulin-like domain-containing protein, partial [Actinomycetota bacterium]
PTPTTMAAIEPADTNDRTDPAPTPTTRPPVRDAQAAKATAVAFLRELGMRDPVAATYRRTGTATAEVGLHPKAAEGGRPFEKVTTLVQLHRYTNGWVPTGAKAANIEVAQPLPFARVLSPLTVSGQSVSYEGTVNVTVTQDRRGTDRVLGKGFVNGGGTELAPFLGAIDFARSVPGADAGWVVFSGDTAGTGIIEATAVRVRFVTGDHRPQILGVSTNPPASGSARLVTLTGSGTLGVTVKAFGADEVRVLLVPSGTDARSHAKLLGVDTTAGADGESWSVSWRYPDQSFHGHLLIQVNGRGGTAEHDGIAVLHT